MRKSSKAMSLLLSGLMATSCFGMALSSVSAASVESESVGVDTAEQRIAKGHQLVYFQFPASVWGNASSVKWNTKKHTANVFCNYYAIYGNQNEVKTRSWEAPSTSMFKDVKASSLYYFDITESGQGEVEEGAEYGILFSTKANAGQADLLQPNTDGYQTCDLYFNSTLIGHTYSVDEPAVTRENTANSQKIDYKAHSDNGVAGPLRKVSTLCAYIDGMNPGNAPASLEMANALKTYLPNPVNEPSFVWAKIQPVLTSFNTTAQDVYDMYVEKYAGKVAEGVPYEPVGDGSDLKSDGTLKDVYRYTSITTTTIEDGVEQTKVEKYPTLDLVRERLNLGELPTVQDVTAVEATMTGTVEGGKALPTITGNSNEYTVSASWAPQANTAAYNTTYTATVTFTPADGYQFTNDTTAALSGAAFDNVSFADGKIVATKAFTTGAEPVHAITTAAATMTGTVAANSALPTVTANTVQYSSVYSWTPSATSAAYDTTYTLTVTFTAKDGYEFNNASTATLNGAAFDNVALQGGKLVATKAFTTGSKPVTNIDEVNVSTDAVIAPGQTVPAGQQFTTPTTAPYAIQNVTWSPADATFAYDTTYTLSFQVVATNNDYALTDATAVQLGYSADSVSASSFDTSFNNGVVTATFTFVMPAEDVPADNYLAAGNEAELFGTAWDATNHANDMTRNADGTYSITLQADKAYSDIQVKTVKNESVWIGDETGNNVTFDITGPGKFTVTWTPNAEYNDGEGVTSVTGSIVTFKDGIDIEGIYAAGNGEGNWLNGASWDPGYVGNEMTMVAENIWEIEFTDVPDGFERQVKFSINGTWTHNFGGEFVENGEVTAADYNGGNITFDTDDICTVKLQLDLREFDMKSKTGAYFTITITYEGEDDDYVGMIGDVNGDGNITIEDATLIQRRGVELEAFDDAQEKLADVNGDGRVSILDVTCIQKYLAEKTEGIGDTGKMLTADGQRVSVNLA